MRKICSILLMFCVFYLLKPNANLDKFAYAESTLYAKALAGCSLYKNKELNEGFNEIYFQIPESYFVTILETVDENCYKVQYGKYVGYVNSNFVIVATFVPIVKTLENIYCDIKQNVGTQIWSAPTTNSDVLTTITGGTKNLIYIASCKGSIPSGGESNLWFYINYTPSENSTSVYEGYIYSESVSFISEIYLNTETNPEIINTKNENDESVIFISTTIKTIIVTIVAVPIILFIAVILYKIIKKFNKNTKQTNNYKYLINNESPDNKVDIEKFKQNQFVRINKRDCLPKFPSYESDDELL